jgi:hypothetical protein
VTGWVRKFDRHKKLNDDVENVHGSLSWSDKAEEYLRLLDATHNSQAVEGSIAADDFAAARMLREHAQSIGNKVAEQNLTTIKRALSIVLSRYNLGRKQRANRVGAVVVPENREWRLTALGQPWIATAAPAGVVLFVRPAMKIHPVADLFPLMAGTEFDGLVEKIRAHGLRDPIKTWNGMLLDGRNRRRASEAAGVYRSLKNRNWRTNSRRSNTSFRPIFILVVTI